MHTTSVERLIPQFFVASDAWVLLIYFMLSKRKFRKEEQKDEMRRFEVLLNSVITRFGLRTIEMSIENQHFHLLFILRSYNSNDWVGREKHSD